MSRRRLGTRRILNFSGGRAPDLMSGADGPLSLNGTVAFVAAGAIKRYSSISIINNGELVIQGFTTYGTSNPGYAPTLIGCLGNCTINTGGKIYVTDNAGDIANYYEDANYSAATIPFDCVVNPITYTRFGGFGGMGGETGGWGTWGGSDYQPTGHGGGGSGLSNGGDTDISYDWGASGYGSDSGTQGFVGPTYPVGYDFGSAGIAGLGGEVGSGQSVGGGGSGGLRGLSGGALLLQIGGTANIATGSIICDGSPGGAGGNGGVADSLDDGSYGGGPGGGGCGGSGGYCWIRYKTGTVSATAVSYNGGSGGLAGAVGVATGPAPSDGFPGQDGAPGTSGGSDIATY